MDILIDVALDQKDKIVISLKYPGIYITQGDNRLQTLVFDRPEIFEQAECVIQFYNSSGLFDEQNIGQSNEFEILNTLTQSTSISFNIYYIIDNVKTQHSNNLLLSIRPSMRALDPTIPIEELPRAVLPTGGTDGQVLAKRSVKNFDTEWVEQTGGGSSTIAWLPEVSTDGDISFKRSNTTVPPSIVNIMGPAGKDGTDGADGKDGEPGPPGTDGIDGKDGERGADGKDGTDGLPGPAGVDGKDGENGAPGPAGKDGIDGSPGVDGKSAYEIALEKGFVGTEEEWLASLQGEDGEPGPAGADGKDGIGVAFWDKEDFGVEYKTNKIRNGKQVYKMLVDCGAIPGAVTAGVQISKDTLLPVENAVDIWITKMQYETADSIAPFNVVASTPVNTPSNYVVRRTTASVFKNTFVLTVYNTITVSYRAIATIEYTKTIDTPETPGPFIIEGLTEVTHDDTLSGKGTVDEPLSVIGGTAAAGQVIGVFGTLERKTISAGTWTKVKFVPTDGNIGDINANGEWICPKDGIYTLFGNFGVIAASVSSSGFALNSPSSFINTSLIGFSNSQVATATPTTNVTSKLKKGDNISFWVNSTVAQTIQSTPSQFSITLQSSIDITVWNMYQQWLESGNEGTYEEFLQAVWNVSIGEAKYIQGSYKDRALIANESASITPIITKSESFATAESNLIRIQEKGLYTLSVDLGNLTPTSPGILYTGLYGPKGQRSGSSGRAITSNPTNWDFDTPPFTFVADPGDTVTFILYSTIARTSIVSPTDANRQLKFTLIKHGSMGEKTDLISSDENNALLLGSDDKLFVPANSGGGYVEYLYNTDDSANSNTTAFATGEEGVLFPNITTFGTKIQKRVKASRSLKNAKITIEQKNTISDLFFIPSPFTYVIQYAARYGIDILPVSGSEDMIDVGFNANGMTPSGATYGANSSHSWAGQRTAGNVWRIRVEYP